MEGLGFAAPAGPRERKWKTKPESLELSDIPVRNLQVFSYLSVIWAQEDLFLLENKITVCGLTMMLKQKFMIQEKE